MQLAESYGLTQEQADEGAVKYWKAAFQKAKEECAKVQTALSADAYKAKDLKTPVGTLIAEFDLDEWVWLKEQYGPDCMKDRDFLMFYRKNRGQEFLATPSKSLFN